jgi:hypothetical protein
VTASDRFCPACGTPNVQCKFQPKFGPALKIVEPRIVFEPAPVGAPSCPRCHRVVQRPQEYCRGCGMDLIDAWRRYEQVHVLVEWRQRTRFRRVPYLPLRGLSLVLRGILTVGAGVAAAIGILELWLFTRSAGFLYDGPATADLLRGLDTITRVAVVLFVAGIVVYISWSRRAYGNLPALAVGDLRFHERWTVAGWLVPGFSLFRPKQVIDDLYRASHPLAPPFSSSWRLSPVTIWSTVWWTALWLGLVLGFLSHAVAPGGLSSGAGDVRLSLVLAGATGLLLAIAACALQVLVARVSERQEARAVFVLDADLEAQLDPAAASAATDLADRRTDADSADAPVVAPTGTDGPSRRHVSGSRRRDAGPDRPSVLVHSQSTVYGRY